MFAWPVALVRALELVRPRGLLEQSLLNSADVTFSSQFSGMGTMEEAMRIISIHVQRIGLKFCFEHFACLRHQQGVPDHLEGDGFMRLLGHRAVL